MLKDFEGRPVCQMNVHKHQIGHRMGTEPLDCGTDAVEHSINLCLRFDFVK